MQETAEAQHKLLSRSDRCQFDALVLNAGVNGPGNTEAHENHDPRIYCSCKGILLPSSTGDETLLWSGRCGVLCSCPFGEKFETGLQEYSILFCNHVLTVLVIRLPNYHSFVLVDR